MGERYDTLTRETALDPATRPLPAYDCPTGTCRTDKVCTEVSLGDAIEPFSREHVERNACNRCPSTNPTPVTRVISQFRNEQNTIVAFYTDREGNAWQPDSQFTAPFFHGDAGLGNRIFTSMTFRLERAGNGGSGWQCRYFESALDDTSLDLGTYDYAPTPSVARALGNRISFELIGNVHNDMDVKPHNGNPNYAPNLTEAF